MEKRTPKSDTFADRDMGLFMDYYEMTGGKADLDHNNKDIITENYFFRKMPAQLGSYVITAGLEQVIRFITSYKLEKSDGKWLKLTSGKDMSDGFIKYLENFKFKGDVYAVPEGTPVFPNEPIISITGPTIDVQLFETYLLNVMNFESLIATKASRVVTAARGRGVMEFGSRRAQGRDAAILAARAAYIGGAVGSALVLAGREFGIPYLGTMPHKFVQERPSEIQAFREYAQSFPYNTVLLIDTYNTLEGAKNACVIGKELKKKGYDLKGVRIDSGDLLVLSKKVREILDSEGMTNTKIFASSDLDEYTIDKLIKDGAPIDSFGVGTRLVTGANYNPLTDKGNVSVLNGVYKLVSVSKAGKEIPKIKISDDKGKTTLPGKKQVFRRTEGEKYIEDVICLQDEKLGKGWAPLLVPIMKAGKIVYDFPDLKELRKYCLEQVLMLPESCKDIQTPANYPVGISEKLKNLQEKMITEFSSV